MLGDALKTNGKLVSLNLSMNNVEDEGVPGLFKALGSNCTLLSLNLGNPPWKALDYNCITADGIKVIVPILETNTSLQELILSRNDIGDKGTESLAMALQKNTTLVALDIGKSTGWILRIQRYSCGRNECFSNDVAEEQNPHQLESWYADCVILDKNQINDQALELFSVSLKTNNVLKSLYLGTVG